MKLNQLPNLRVEDFMSEQSWISKLFVQLNPFIQSVNQVFDQNVDFSTNIKAVTKEYTISTFQEFSFQWPFPTYPPMDLRVLKATKTTQLIPTILLAAWSYDTGTKAVTVENLLEVTSDGISELSGRYQFTVRATI